MPRITPTIGLMPEPVVLIGYSGHGFVAADILQKMGHPIAGYCDQVEKLQNPFQIPYLGPETAEILAEAAYFVAIGDNTLRRKVTERLFAATQRMPLRIAHPTATLGSFVEVGAGVLVAAGAILNPLAQLAEGVIANTGCIIEHECRIGAYAHIAPGAVLAGNVHVGENSFIGANVVIKQGIRIGKNVTIGAGAVVIRDVEDGMTVAGSPAKNIVK
jgi:sugar O-acyltransferase (sialic acid O-acetyltransferase NeuD family)